MLFRSRVAPTPRVPAETVSTPARIPPPLEFRGWHPGMSAAEAQAQYMSRRPGGQLLTSYDAWRCQDLGDGAARCVGLAEPIVTDFVDDRLALAQWNLPEDGFADLRDALVAKFGAPTAQAEKHYRNAMGATFVGAVLTWTSGDTRLEISQYASQVDQCRVMLYREPAFRRFAALTKAQPDI